MTSRVQTLRTSTSGAIPPASAYEPGQLFVNFADLKIGVVTPTSPTTTQGKWLTAIPNFSPAATYAKGDLVVNGTHILRANTGITPAAFDQRQWTPIDSDITYGPNSPVNPQAGDLWYDTGATPLPQLKIWDGAAGTPAWQVVFNTAGFVAKTGDTMTGPLVVPAGATGAQVPQAQDVVAKTGDTMTGPLVVPAGATGAQVPQAQEVVATTGGTMTGPLNLAPASPGNAIITNPPGGADQAINGLITLDGHYPLVGFDTLTLNVALTGTANPADPIGDEAGSGDTFVDLGTCLKYVSERLSVKNLEILMASGTYTESIRQIDSPSSVGNISLIGSGAIIDCESINFRSPVTLNNLEIRGLGTAKKYYWVCKFEKSVVFINNVTIRSKDPTKDAVWVYDSFYITDPTTIIGQVRGFDAAILRLNNKLTVQSSGNTAIQWDGNLVVAPGSSPQQIATTGSGKKIKFLESSSYLAGPKLNITNGGVLELSYNKLNKNGWFRDSFSHVYFVHMETPSLSPNVNHTVTLPLTLPGAVYEVFGVSVWGATIPNVNVGVSPTGNRSQISVQHNHSGSMPVAVLVIGS